MNIVRPRLLNVLGVISPLLVVIALALAPMWQSAAQATSSSVPGAPTNLAATAGDSRVTLTWEAPSSNGGSSITGYEYRHIMASPKWLSIATWTSAETALTVDVTGLINGREHSFEVRAVNSVGEGASAIAQATPVGPGPLTALNVRPGTLVRATLTDRQGTLSPEFSSSTYEYTVAVLHGDTHLTFEPTTETGHGKELRIVGDLGYGEFWYAARDFGPTLPGHQVRLFYGENRYRYAVYESEDGTESEAAASGGYFYDVTVTRPYPPIEISADFGIDNSMSQVENRTQLLNKYGVLTDGYDIENQTWTLTGNDSDDFTLTREGSGYRQHVLRFSQIPDYENPTDSDTDNVYEVTIQVSEDDETDSLDATVTVTDVDSDPGAPVHWFSVWDGSVDDPPLEPGATLEVTEGETLSISMRPNYAPTRLLSNQFTVTAYTSDSAKLVLSGPSLTVNNRGSIYWSSSGNGWQTYNTVTFTAPEDADTDDDTVTLRFRNINGGYSNDWTEFAVSIVDNDEPTAPGQPRSVDVRPSGTGRLAVTWDSPESNGGSVISEYKVQWKEATDNWDTPANVSEATTTDTAYAITGLSLGVEYSVRVIATNSVGDGPASAVATETADAQTSQQQVATSNNPATGAPTISGTPEVGQTLSAETSGISDPDGIANATFTYQWIRSDGTTDVDIAGATNSTYGFVSDDVGKTIKVRVFFADDAGNVETLTSSATPVVVAAADQPEPEPTDRPHGLRTIMLRNGNVLLTWQAPAANSRPNNYRILRHRPEEGEPDPLVYVESTSGGVTNYADTAVEAGTLYVYSVQVLDTFGQAGDASYPASVRVPGSNNPATGAPSVRGTPRVGKTLVASTSGISDADGLINASFSYQWISNDGTTDTDISGATGRTYTPLTDDEGKAIKVRVSFTDDAGNGETLTSVSVGPVLAVQTDSVAPTALWARLSVPGEDEGIVLEWTAPPGTVTGYQILRSEAPFNAAWSFPLPNGCTIESVVHVQDTGNDATTYTDADVALDAEYTYWVKAINSNGVGPQSYPTSKRYRPHAWWPRAEPGSPAPPQNLASARVNDGIELTWDAPEGEVSGYQILRTRPEQCEHGFRVYVDNTGNAEPRWIDTNVQPGTLYRYHVRAINDVGVGSLDHASNSTSIRPARGIGSGQPNSPATGAPTITGTVQVGETLTADTSGIADEDGLNGARFYYQWLSGQDTEIQDATSATYTLLPADEGKTIRVRVSFTDDALHQEVLTSSGTAEVTAGTQPTQVQVVPPEDNSAPGAPRALWSRLSVRGEPEGNVLHWSAPPGTITGYRILRSAKPVDLETWGHGCNSQMVVHVSDTGSDATTYVDADVAEGAIYIYRVKAINSNGVGPQSDSTRRQYRPHVWWPAGVPGTPLEVTTLESSRVYDGTDLEGIELTWDPPRGAVTGYQILRRLPEQCEYGFRVYVENTNSTDTSWTDSNVEIGTLYEYHVRAINDAGVGPVLHSDSEQIRALNKSLGVIIASSGRYVTIGVDGLKNDADPTTVDYTFRGDVTFDVDGSDADACEGDGLGEDIQWTVVDDGSKHFEAEFGGVGCNAGSYALTFVLKDRDGQVIGTFPFPQFKVVGGANPNNIPATGATSISGTAQVGERLTADTSSIGDPNGADLNTLTYQWVRIDGTTDADIAGATTATYLVTTDDVGKTIKVRVSFTDGIGTVETLTSAATAAVAAGVPGAPQSPAVERGGTGELVVSWEEPDSNGGSSITGYMVQWKEATGNWDTAADVSEATTTNTSYTITSLSLGTEYTVRVIATNSVGNGPTSEEVKETADAQTSQQQAATQNTPATGTPTISGTLEVGRTLSAETSGIDDADGLVNAVFTYQWIRSDGTTHTDISGATGSTYTLTSDDEGKTIKVLVSFTDDEGNDETLTSAATAAVEAALTAELQNVPSSHHGSGRFTFRILFSEPVTAGFTDLKQHAFEVSNATIKRAQRVDGRNDLRKFTIQPSSDADVVLVLPATEDCADEGAICTSGGKRLSTRLEITVPGPAPANSAATGAPTISGTSEVGQTLTASTSGISDADGLANATFSYQWLADDNAISGATDSTYTLVDADEGKAVKVRVSFTDDGGNEETLTSDATAAVEARPNSPATGTPTISGTPEVGQTLTADTSGISDADGLSSVAFNYQWLADGADILGATGGTYTLTDTEEGKAIKVRVSFTDDGGNDEVLTSVATAAVSPSDQQEEESNSEPTDRPHGLRASVDAGTVVLNWNAPDDAGSVTMYRILRHRPEEGESDPLVYVDYTHSRATSYTDTAVEPGKLYTYSVQAADFLGYVGEASAPASVRVPGSNSPATGAPTITGTAQVGQTLSVDTSGIEDADGLTNASFSYQWLTDDADISGATGSTYTLVDTDKGKAIKVRVSFTDDEGNDETLTSAATSAVLAALTAEFLDTPSSHNGQTAFTFELRFSEEFDLSYVTLRDHAFTVTGGEVTKARRLERDSTNPNIRWEITVTPNVSGDVTIVLPVTEDCEDDGAICTGDGRKLSNRTELTVTGSSG